MTIEEEERAQSISQRKTALSNMLRDAKEAMDYIQEQLPNWEEFALADQEERLHGYQEFFNFTQHVLTAKRRRTSRPTYRNVDSVVGYL